MISNGKLKIHNARCMHFKRLKTLKLTLLSSNDVMDENEHY